MAKCGGACGSRVGCVLIEYVLTELGRLGMGQILEQAEEDMETQSSNFPWNR